MAESDKPFRRSAKKIRCAIYTRKATDEGLDQAFNSLDAQREACAALSNRKNMKVGCHCRRSITTAAIPGVAWSGRR